MTVPPLPQVVYDSGALLAAERAEGGIWTFHNRLLRRGGVPIVPAPVIVQAWRGGGRQANLARLLKGVVVRPLDSATARLAGQLCGRASTADVTDAVVAVVASAVPCVLLTSDPGDLGHLLSHQECGDRVEIRRV